MVVTSLILSAVAVLISVGSLGYFRRQTLAGERVTSIEASRRHDDLTPELVIRCQEQGDGQAGLTVQLAGPAGLDRLDEVTIAIRNDRPGRDSPGPGSQLTAEQLAGVIWGPYRFSLGQDHTAPPGRTYGPVPLPKNEPLPVALERAFPPSWHGDPQRWRAQYDDAPVRLQVTCRRDGYEPWTVLCEVGVEADPANQVW